MSERDWRATPPCELRALVRRWSDERRWWSSRFAVLVCAMASNKDGTPLRPKDIFRELSED